MQPIDRVMQAYGLMENLSLADERAAREKLEVFLAGRHGDETVLAVEGLRYLRGSRTKRRRRPRLDND